MMTTIKSKPNSVKNRYSNWCFLPQMLSGTAGIIIGWAIAFISGWI